MDIFVLDLIILKYTPSIQFESTLSVHFRMMNDHNEWTLTLE